MSARPAVKLSRLLFATLLAVGVVLPQPVLARSADGALDMMDKDGDGRLSKDEWRKKKMFDQLDRDGDGYATREELQVFFGEEAGGGGATDTANAERPDEATMRAMLRDSRGDFDAARARGLVATGLHPV
ncbi:MAG: EF-hand domain-containing protein, partial [bacterium]|nr:EF-hand domain-containing protein [bacterium]